MLNLLWNVIFFIIAVSILISVHEFGHFWFARRFGVKVELFSIGFGKKIWSYTDKQGTQYVVGIIPLGGYIKMLDERFKKVPVKLLENSFNHKTIIQRAVIISAGPIANFIFAMCAYWLVFLIGIPSIRPVITDIISGSPIAKLKIPAGSEIKAIDDIETPDWNTIRMILAAKVGADKIVISVSPYGSKDIYNKTINLHNWKFEPEKQDPVILLGIQPEKPKVQAVLKHVQQHSAASKAGLQVGDKIVKVNGNFLKEWQDFATTVRNNLNKKIDLEVERQGKTFNLTLIPEINPLNRLEGFAGVRPNVHLSNEYRMLYQYTPFVAIGKAIIKTWQLIKITTIMLGKLITGNVKINNLSGPISIAKGAGISAECGFTYYLIFLALISVNLGIINLLPLPVLDGGHLLFLLIEKIKGGPVSEKIQNFVYHIGFIFLVFLMGFTIINDFFKNIEVN